jgi:hypothetical protein
VIALSGNNNADDARAPHAMSSASVKSEQPTETALGQNSPQVSRIENEVDKDPKRAGPTVEVNSEDHKKAICTGNNPSCLNVPPPDRKRRGIRMPAANDALAIGRVPIGRPDAFAETTSAAPSASPEHSTGSESPTGEPDSSRLSPTRPYKTSRKQNRARQNAPNHHEGYDRPVRDLGPGYSLDRSFAQKGFWDWSR